MKLFAALFAALILASGVCALALPSFADPAPARAAANSTVPDAPPIKGAPPSLTQPEERPPVVTCTWDCGKLGRQGGSEDLGVKYRMFHPDGEASRATTTNEGAKQKSGAARDTIGDARDYELLPHPTPAPRIRSTATTTTTTSP